MSAARVCPLSETGVQRNLETTRQAIEREIAFNRREAAQLREHAMQLREKASLHDRERERLERELASMPPRVSMLLARQAG